MPTDTRSTLAKLLEDRLGEDPVEYVHREHRPAKSYRAIAEELSEKTGIDVSYETIRRWAAA